MNSNTLIRLITALLIASTAILTGCNDDIFVERTPDHETSENEATISGDGGTHTFDIQYSRLKYINAVPYDDMIINYYNSEGDYISSESPADEIARITYSTIGFELNIDFIGSTATATCNENAIFDNEITIYLDLEYKYATETLKINITPGTHVQLVDIEYDFAKIEPSPNPPLRQHTYKTTYNNPSDQPLAVGIVPTNYLKATASLTTRIDWASQLSGMVPLPTFNGESWSTTPPHEIRLGQYFDYIPVRFETDQIITLTVPPKESIRVTFTVNYIKAEIPIEITTLSPFTDTKIWLYGKCELTEPVSYEIDTQTIQ